MFLINHTACTLMMSRSTRRNASVSFLSLTFLISLLAISAAASRTTRRSPAPWSELVPRRRRTDCPVFFSPTVPLPASRESSRAFYEREFLEVEAIPCEYNRRAFLRRRQRRRTLLRIFKLQILGQSEPESVSLVIENVTT